MKKSFKLFGLFIVCLALASCGHATLTYQGAWRQGQRAVKAEKYQQAQTAFQKAVKLKRTKQATAALTQVKAWRAAKKAQGTGNYTQVAYELKVIKQTKPALTVLHQKATKLQQTSQTVIKQTQVYQRQLAKARALSDNGNIVGSNQKLKELLATPALKQAAYRQVRQEASALKEANADQLKQMQKNAQ